MKRPKFLTIWLILMTLSGIYSLYGYTLGSANIKAFLPNVAGWVFGVFTLLSLLNLISVGLLWSWKKIGFYLIIASAILIASINGMILGVAGVGASIMALIGVGILYLAMKPVWQSFK